MAIIRLSCTESGNDIERSSSNVRLVEWDDGASTGLTYECPECRTTEYKIITSNTAKNILRAAGVTMDSLTSPVRESGDGPPISYDEILDFHSEIESVGEIRLDNS